MAKKNSKTEKTSKVIKSKIPIKSAKAKGFTTAKIKKDPSLQKTKTVVKAIKQIEKPSKSKTLEKVKKMNGAIKKEPSGKFELEYVVNGSPGILYEFLSTSTGLSEWFADDVNVKNNIYTFFWDKSEQQAKLLKLEVQKFIRLQWLDKNDGSYFEFKIEKDDITGDISLIITDFADNIAERQSSKLLWDNQIGRLLHIMGTY